MKKFILPLLVLLFVGSLFAVESDPSEVVGYVKYDCVAGLNVVALPMDQGYMYASEVTDAYPGMMDAISYWDATNQVWQTAIDLGGFWDPDFEVEPGMGLMLNAVAPFSMYSLGDMPASNATYSLVNALNLIMVPLNRSDLAYAGDLGIDVAVTDAISYWDAGSQVWQTAIDLGGFWDPDFEVSIGMPLMVNAFSTGTWPSRGVTPTLMKSNK